VGIEISPSTSKVYQAREIHCQGRRVRLISIARETIGAWRDFWRSLDVASGETLDWSQYRDV
jgi:hypothetical protein